MILDESMTMSIPEMEISCKGNFIKVDTLTFKHPLPTMAKYTFKMRKYFTQISTEGQKVLDSFGGDELRQIIEDRENAKAELTAGSETEAIHEKFADDAPVSREDRLKEIEDLVDAFKQMVNLCTGVDLYQMTEDFGAMILNTKRCGLCNKDMVEGEFEPLSITVWNQHIQEVDRLEAAIRYCCFFGLTSNTRK